MRVIVFLIGISLVDTLCKHYNLPDFGSLANKDSGIFTILITYCLILDIAKK